MKLNKNEVKICIWLYDKGVLGLIMLALELFFTMDVEKLGKKLGREIFK